MNKNIKEIKKNIEEYLTLKKYVFIMGAFSILCLMVQAYLSAFLLLGFSILGLILIDKYKAKLEI